MKVSELILMFAIILLSLYLGTFVLSPKYYKKTIIEGNEPLIPVDTSASSRTNDLINNEQYSELQNIKESVPYLESKYTEYKNATSNVEKKNILMSMK